MTDLRELEKAASPAPWEYIPELDPGDGELQDGRGEMVANNFRDDFGAPKDAALIAATRNALPFLLDGMDALRRIEMARFAPADDLRKAARDALAALDAHLSGK